MKATVEAKLNISPPTPHFVHTVIKSLLFVFAPVLPAQLKQEHRFYLPCMFVRYPEPSVIVTEAL